MVRTEKTTGDGAGRWPVASCKSDYAKERAGYEAEFLRRAEHGGVWYALLSALLYFGGESPQVPWAVVAIFLSLQLLAFWIRFGLVAAQRADAVAQIAIVQSMLFGLFVAFMIWSDPSAQTIALALVSGCGLCTAGTNTMAIHPGRHAMWVVAATAPPLLALLVSDVQRFWPLGLAVVAFSAYLVVQGRHILGGFAHTRRDAAELRATSAKKRALVSHLSHDIQTPLAAVVGYMQLAQETHNRSDLQHYVGTAELQLRSSLDLLNHLLDVAKMDFNHQAANITTFSPGAAVLTTATLHQLRAREKSVELTVVTSPGENLMVRGSAMGLARSLTNLLSNAVRYTDAGSIQVHLVLSERGPGRHGVLLEVRDTGVGIGDDVVRHVERVMRGQSPTPLKSARGGEGIGLSGTAFMLRSIGGHLDIKSSSAGSTVRVWMPVSLSTKNHAALATG